MELWLALPLLAVLHDVPEERQQIRLELRCRDAMALVATLHNDGTADTSVGLGTVMNGTRQLVDNLRVMVHPKGEPEHFRMYRPRDYPVGGSFALHQWTVQLPAGGTYSMVFAARDFEGWRSVTSIPPSTLKLRWVVARPTPTWPLGGQSTDALVSNEIHVPDDCR